MFSLVSGISKLLSRNAGNCFVLGYIEKFCNFWRDLYFCISMYVAYHIHLLLVGAHQNLGDLELFASLETVLDNQFE
jgi:hypothetical protein